MKTTNGNPHSENQPINAIRQFASVGSTSMGEYFFHGECQRQADLPLNGPALFAPDFFMSDKTPWWVFAGVEKRTFLPATDMVVPLDFKFRPPSYEDFGKDFSKIHAAIAANEIEKAVPVVLAMAEADQDFFTTAGILSVYQNLKLNCTDNRTLCFLNASNQGLAGLTPELLFDWDIKTNTVTTMALAGTSASANPQNLLQDPKELHEHQLVIEGILKALQPLGRVEVGSTVTIKAGQLHHLKTPIQCQLSNPSVSDRSFNDLVRTLHPTPALGLHSKIFDFNWLKNLAHAADRMRFGAPFGVWDPEVGFKIFVAIRNLQWKDNALFLFSGCGVVGESRIESEWNELTRKRQSVLKDLGASL